jgi:hypothetical protein
MGLESRPSEVVMPEVNRYRVVLYGASSEKPNLKAKVELYAAPREATPAAVTGAVTASVGKIKFHDGPLPPDAQEKGQIVMNLPSTMLGQVVELLRTESPVYFAFHEGRAVFGTGVEEVGTDDEHVPRLVKVVEEGPRPVPSPLPTA